MHTLILWGVGGAVVFAFIAVIVALRRNRPMDLGSVSTAWTTEHSLGYRGGDGSTS